MNSSPNLKNGSFSTRKEVTCETCSLIFLKSVSQVKRSKSGRSFCSRTCAAKYNNKLYPKRQLEGNCAICSRRISSELAFCAAHKYGVPKQIKDMTLAEAKYNQREQSNVYTAVRTQATSVVKAFFIDSNSTRRCLICGYKNFTDICHIRSIASFTLDTLVKEVNSLENLSVLCPNHHREFDRGLLQEAVPSLFSLEKAATLPD